MSTYEAIRKKNLEDNRRILAELGLVNPFKPLGRVVPRGIKRKAPSAETRPRKVLVKEDLSNCGSIHGVRRRSARIQGKPAGTDGEWLPDEEEDDEEDRPKRIPPNRPNFYGAVEGVEVGTVWTFRIDCSRDGIHRPTVAGIHGGPDGAYSIALSGGYDDNIDLGECFTYTGEGGRDLKGTASNPKNLRTAPQSKDQTLSRGNLALSKNCENGNPVRVIRGYKLDSPFAPEDGYRYDGLYTVEKFWYTTGLSGYQVWKFALRRCKDQTPPPWEVLQKNDSPKKERSIDTEEEKTEEIKSAALEKVCDDENNNVCAESKTLNVDENKPKNSESRNSSDTEVSSQADSGVESDMTSVPSSQSSDSSL